MLSRPASQNMYDNKAVLLYEQLFHAIYNRGCIYDTQSCPFVGEVSALMDVLSSFTTPLKETWLLFVPVCINHRPCIFCFQEPDDRIGRGVQTLRKKVINTASQVLHDTYQDATESNRFVSPLIASSRALVSGCSIAIGISKQWTTSQSHMRDLMKCTEILSLFAPHWKGGHDYINVWRAVIDLLDIRSK